MNKKVFGIKISTILSFIGCLFAAVLFWLFVKYSEFDASEAAAAVSTCIRGLI